MPWSGYWGANANAWVNSHGLGYPAQLWDDVPKSQKVSQDILPKVGWTVEKAPVSLDAAVQTAKAAGIRPGFDISIPSDATGVYSAAIYPDDVAGQHTIHIDQYSRRPAVDLSYSQYPILGKTIEWGISVHQGQEYGRFNQFIMLATCLAIILSCVTGLVMWWKRRPSGRLGVPPMPPKRSVYVGLWVIAAVFAVAFPLTGLAIVVMVAFDQLVVRFIPPLRRAFS